MKNKLFFLVVLMVLVSWVSKAQIGIGTDNPNARAILDISAIDKGVLFPRLDSGQIDAMTLSPVPPAGMMVYNADSNEVYVFYGAKWHSITPFKKEHNQASPNKGRIIAAKNALTISQLDANTVNALNGNGIVPIGAILMWSGTTIPPGYGLCDGGTYNGHPTPDLRARFVVGYSSLSTDYGSPGLYSQHANYLAHGGTATPNYLAGSTGGASKVSLDLTQIPRHTHGVNDPGHRHSITIYEHSVGGGEADCSCDRGDDLYQGAGWKSENTTSITTGISIQYSGGTGTAQSASNGADHENRPPYYTLAFIMRVK